MNFSFCLLAKQTHSSSSNNKMQLLSNGSKYWRCFGQLVLVASHCLAVQLCSGNPSDHDSNRTANRTVSLSGDAGWLNKRNETTAIKQGQIDVPRPDSESANIASLVAAGYLLAERTDARLSPATSRLDARLAELLDRDGPDMRPSRDYKDFKDITVELAQRAWQLMHGHAKVALEQRIALAWPAIDALLRDARVSNKCHRAIALTLDQAKLLRSWAVKMINAWGSFPMNTIFEGTYSDVGAFHSCLDIEQRADIGHAHYCSVTFRPVLPSRAEYDLVVRHEPDALRLMFESTQTSTDNHQPTQTQPPMLDAFSELLEHAQYNHFVYYKWGTCWPIDCSPFDVRRLAKLVARRNIMLNGPVKCYSKNSTDYEQPDDDNTACLKPNNCESDTVNCGLPTLALEQQQQQQHWHHMMMINVSQDNLTSAHNSNTNTSKPNKQTLEISIWDKNNGIFIWKPHFNRSHKIALAIILLATLLIIIMSLIDLIFNILPRQWRNIMLALKAMPLNNGCSAGFGAHAQQRQQQQQQQHAVEPHSPPDGRLMGQTATGCLQIETSGFASKAGFMMVPTNELNATQSQQLPASPTTNQHKHYYNQPKSVFMSVVDDCSLFTNVAQFFRVSKGQMKNDILCLNGIRCITMFWIIMTHTMMYNDWSAFGRTHEVERALNSLITQPLFNGSYLVDTFFLMSGLLSSFTAFRHCQGIKTKFNSFAYIFGRWLRLTPQIFFISMIFIVFPALSYGPHWFPIVGEYSENCVSNWWINVIHAQSFYKKEEMCNFVTWWISIDFFYHFFALAIIWVILLAGHKMGFTSMAILVISQVTFQSIRHYNLRLPPNILATIPQTGSMWSKMTLDFFWTPYSHSVPFFFGFYIGYLMALKKKLIMKNLNTRRALIGWTLSISLLLGQSYSTFWWVTGKADYSPLVSTIFYSACSIIWAGSLCWIIVACHHGYGGFVNRVLSWKVFIVLGKASYLVYLSHFQVLFLFFGNQNLLLEPSNIVMLYVVFGNVLLSTLWGIFLCSVYELPWLKTHRRLMKYV